MPVPRSAIRTPIQGPHRQGRLRTPLRRTPGRHDPMGTSPPRLPSMSWNLEALEGGPVPDGVRVTQNDDGSVTVVFEHPETGKEMVTVTSRRTSSTGLTFEGPVRGPAGPLDRGSVGSLDRGSARASRHTDREPRRSGWRISTIGSRTSSRMSSGRRPVWATFANGCWRLCPTRGIPARPSPTTSASA